MVPKIAGAFGAIRRGIHLAQSAYPQRLKRVHVVGVPPYLVAPLQLMRSCVNEKVRRRVRAFLYFCVRNFEMFCELFLLVKYLYHLTSSV